MSNPAGDQATGLTRSACPEYVRALLPSGACPAGTVLSALAEAISSPADGGDQATPFTAPLWPWYVNGLLPSAAAQTCTVLSALPEAISDPSGDHATVLTTSLWLL